MMPAALPTKSVEPAMLGAPWIAATVE